MYKVFKVKRGKISFREKMEFDSLFEEFKWRLQMIMKGCKVQQITNRDSAKLH